MAGPRTESDTPNKYAEAEYLCSRGDEAMRDGDSKAAEQYYEEAASFL